MLSYVINQVKTRVELLCSMRMEAKNKKLIMSCDSKHMVK